MLGEIGGGCSLRMFLAVESVAAPFIPVFWPVVVLYALSEGLDTKYFVVRIPKAPTPPPF